MVCARAEEVGRQQCDGAWTAAEQAMKGASGRIRARQGREHRYKQVQRAQMQAMARAKVRAANLRKARQSGMVARHDTPEMQAFNSVYTATGVYNTLAQSLEGQAEALSGLAPSPQVLPGAPRNAASLMQREAHSKPVSRKRASSQEMHHNTAATKNVKNTKTASSNVHKPPQKATAQSPALVQLKLALKKTAAGLKGKSSMPEREAEALEMESVLRTFKQEQPMEGSEHNMDLETEFVQLWEDATETKT